MSEYEKTDQQWREQLSEQEFIVCRQKGTERPFTGEYCDTKAAGVYLCKCCAKPLFDADSKYDSGSGWPSFYQPLDKQAVAEHSDGSLGMARVEVTCDRCGSHLGHVFNDGPAPTGMRYCVNSASLTLQNANDD